MKKTPRGGPVYKLRRRDDLTMPPAGEEHSLLLSRDQIARAIATSKSITPPGSPVLGAAEVIHAAMNLGFKQLEGISGKNGTGGNIDVPAEIWSRLNMFGDPRELIDRFVMERLLALEGTGTQKS